LRAFDGGVVYCSQISDFNEISTYFQKISSTFRKNLNSILQFLHIQQFSSKLFLAKE